MASTKHGTKYRPEIDGLRGVAVVAVILYHAGVSWLPGGFVGVDVFFVISGYLITQIIVADLDAGRFSIAAFYERRARRILPALFAVLGFSLIAGAAWMTPDQLRFLAKSVVAVTVFMSNILFARSIGYFEPSVRDVPLLHTWSLAVEEQYYLIFPLFLGLAWRCGRRWLFGLTTALAIASLCLAQLLSRASPSADFFLAPPRIWELLIGALVALRLTQSSAPVGIGPWGRELLSAAGLAMIIVAAVEYSAWIPFPSVYALLPTTGAALLLASSGTDTLTGRFLSSKWLVGVGLISYSAYLWHQPLFAFARVLTVGRSDARTTASLIIASFVIAYLSWRFIETPFRDRTRLSRATVITLSAGVSLCFVAVATGIFLAERTNEVAEWKVPNYGLGPACAFVERFAPIPECRTSATPTVMIWGDSFAMHNVPGLVASDSLLGIVQATKSWCGPLIGIASVSTIERGAGIAAAEDCLRFNNSVIAHAEQQRSIRTVVLASIFSQYVDPVYETATVRGNQPSSVSTAAAYLEDTIRRLRAAGKRVVIIAPPPAADFNIADCVARRGLGKLTFAPAGCEIARSDYLARYGAVFALLQQVEHESGTAVIRFDSLLCNEARCRPSLDGVSLYRDDEHLSIAGSRYLGIRLHLADRVARLAR